MSFGVVREEAAAAAAAAAICFLCAFSFSFFSGGRGEWLCGV